MVKKGPCSHCKINSTPLWRNGPADKPVLCNACGSRYKLKGHLDNYLPKHVHPTQFKNDVESESEPEPEPEPEPEDQLSNQHHVPPTSMITTNGVDCSDKSTPDVHHISPQDFGKKIPSRKRSSAVYKRMTPMEKFQKQLVKLYRSEKHEEESVLVDNVNNFIPQNEIGLGAISLNSTTDQSFTTAS